MTRTLTPLFALLAFVPACAWDGHFNVLGYSTKPNYDTNIRTVRVPICRNHTRFNVNPVPGVEMDLQRAIVREIQTKTPYKVTQDNADTELLCTIVGFQKNMLVYTQFNTIREAETVMTVELIWRDLRTGEILSKSGRQVALSENDPRSPLLATPDSILPPGSKPILTPGAPTQTRTDGTMVRDDEVSDPVMKKPVVPVTLRSTATFRPELGESITTAMQRNIDRMAVQIVSAMEIGWNLPPQVRPNDMATPRPSP